MTDTCEGPARVGRPVTWLVAGAAWLVALLAEPALDTVDRPSAVAAAALLAAAVATGAAVLGGVLLTGTRRWWVTHATLGVLAAVTVATTLTYGPPWWSLWVLLGATAGGSLPGREGVLAVLVVPLAALVVIGTGSGTERWPVALTAFLAALANHVLVRLLEAIDALRRARLELAERAVAEERERFSRDLHDLLGHTLSVVVVKAEAARRLVHRDPQAAERHALDIETIGRQALDEVREAVEGYRRPTLAAELRRGREALAAAGIALDVDEPGLPLPAVADETFAWVVREAVTNVLRHSGAASCRIAVRTEDGSTSLDVADDGTGAHGGEAEGGLRGLRQRLAAVGGDLELPVAESGFRLHARVPDPARRTPATADGVAAR